MYRGNSIQITSKLHKRTTPSEIHQQSGQISADLFDKW